MKPSDEFDTSMGQISRALITLPRIPEWWILNIAAMRTGTVLLPGTTQLTADDIASKSFYNNVCRVSNEGIKN